LRCFFFRFFLLVLPASLLLGLHRLFWKSDVGFVQPMYFFFSSLFPPLSVGYPGPRQAVPSLLPLDLPPEISGRVHSRFLFPFFLFGGVPDYTPCFTVLPTAFYCSSFRFFGLDFFQRTFFEHFSIFPLRAWGSFCLPRLLPSLLKRTATPKLGAERLLLWECFPCVFPCKNILHPYKGCETVFGPQAPFFQLLFFFFPKNGYSNHPVSGS